MISDSTKRFSSRVENYIRFRPGYPPDVLDVLRVDCVLTADSVVADIGSGTGIFSEVFLKNGNAVFGVEPNDEMRHAAERLLAGFPLFTSVKGTAEATTLAGGSVDVITAAQAFHWFDRTRTRAEFERVLKPDGRVALIWNDRQLDTTPFLREYEALLQRFGTDYLAVRHRDLDLGQVREFIGSDDVKQTVVESSQFFGYEGVEGRLLSSSYAPEAGHPNHEPMLAALRDIFERHQVAGAVEIRYDTRVFTARLHGR